MRFEIIIASMPLILLLAGCGSQPMSQQEVALIEAQMRQQTLTVNCPAGCEVSYRDPRDKIQIPRHTNGWDAAIAVAGSAERLVGGAIVPYAFVELGKSGFKALKGSGETHTTTIGDYSGASSGRVGDYSGANAGSSTDIMDYSGSVGDYSGAGSGNSGSIANDVPGRVSSPNEGRLDSPDDYSQRTSGGFE